MDIMLKNKIKANQERYTNALDKFNTERYRWASTLEWLVRTHDDSDVYVDENEVESQLEWLRDYENEIAKENQRRADLFDANQERYDKRKAK